MLLWVFFEFRGLRFRATLFPKCYALSQAAAAFKEQIDIVKAEAKASPPNFNVEVLCV